MKGVIIGGLHVAALYSMYLFAIGEIKWQNIFVSSLFGFFSAIGVTIGAHRLWAHRAFKAKWPLRLILAFCNTCALETDIYDWCRDHRVHHKFSETNADPHNANRGFFFAHCGWLMVKKHPAVTEKGSKIDLSDVLNDPIVAFQRRYYLVLGLICWGLIPTYLGVYLFNERPLNSFLFNVIFRYVFVLNGTWNVNSAAHIFGNRPYNVKINPRENKAVTYLSFGEGYHNYHHAFPYDYSASEFGFENNFNMSTAIIDFFAKIGQAYDLKKPSYETVRAKIEKDGDHTFGGNTTFLNTLIDWAFGICVAFSSMLSVLVLRFIFTGSFANKV